jgi:D-threo-aldose 1-dehydrogenase
MNNKLEKFSIGTSAFGSRVSDEKSIKIIEKQIYNGINKIDTSPFYGFGYAEKNIGIAIKNFKRENLSISSKFGILPPKISNLTRKIYPIIKKIYSIPGISSIINKNINYKKDDLLSLEQINESIFQSLCNLNTNYLDCLFVHTNLNEYLTNPEIIDYLLDLKNKNIIKQIGVTTSKIDEGFLKLVSMHCNFIDTIQIPYKEYNEFLVQNFKINYFSIFSNKSYSEDLFIKKYHANNGNFIILNTNLNRIDKRLNYFKQIL